MPVWSIFRQCRSARRGNGVARVEQARRCLDLECLESRTLPSAAIYLEAILTHVQAPAGEMPALVGARHAPATVAPVAFARPLDAILLSAAEVATPMHRRDSAAGAPIGGPASAMPATADDTFPAAHSTHVELLDASAEAPTAHEFGAGEAWAHWELVHDRGRLPALLFDTRAPQDSGTAAPTVAMRGDSPAAVSAEGLLIPGVGPAFTTTLFIALAEGMSANWGYLAAAPVVDMSDSSSPEPATSSGAGVELSAGVSAVLPEFGRLIDEALAFDLGDIEREMQQLLRQCDRLLSVDTDSAARFSVVDAAQTVVLLLFAWELSRRRARPPERRPFSAERGSVLAIWPNGAVEDGP
jgi:hypothetical protein